MATSLMIYMDSHSLKLGDFCALPLQHTFPYDHRNYAHSMKKKIKPAALKPMITGLSL